MTSGEPAIAHDEEQADTGRDPAPWDEESPGSSAGSRIAATASSGASTDVGPPVQTAGERAARRDADLRLARLHLRLGALTLARAELESANEEVQLSAASLLDLADARWRTGDLSGAGAAAEAWLAENGLADSRTAPGSRSAGHTMLLPTVIAAEAALAVGRGGDASDFAATALEMAGQALGEALDAVFAGMPRSALWPADPFEAGLTGGAPGGPGRRSGGSAGLAGLPRTRLETPRPAPIVSFARPRASGQGANIDPVAELAAAEADLDAGDVTAAAIRLGVVLRLAPALAPAALELLEGAAGPLAALIRGDAFRLVGREAEAELAFAEATYAISPDATEASADSPRQVTLEDAP